MHAGLLALGSTALDDRHADLPLAQELLEGCIKAYQMTPTHVGPEEARVDPGSNGTQPMLKADAFSDPKYILRPEYVESLFVLHRVTNDSRYQELGWEVFEALQHHCRTEMGYAGLEDV